MKRGQFGVAIYYWLQDDKRFYRDFTGTGQTINATHPAVRDLILDALRYWVIEMHVDGFRLDLASVLGRDRWGRVLADAPLLERIAEDPAEPSGHPPTCASLRPPRDA